MKNSSFLIEIVSPESVKKFDVEWARVATPSGGFTVGPGHSPIISILLSDSVVELKPINGNPTDLTISNGILIVSENGSARALITDK